MVVVEFGMGIVEDKVIKNYFVFEYIYNVYKDEKICGVLLEDDIFGIIIIVEFIGIICGIVLIINLILIVIFKLFISLKMCNVIIFFLYLCVKEVINKVVDIVLQVVIVVGVLKDLIGWIDQLFVELFNVLMYYLDINLILVIGGSGMVKVVYSFGKFVIGVGVGNILVVIDEIVDIKCVVVFVLMFKIFDNGVICVFEQFVVVVDLVYDVVCECFVSYGGYLLQGKELKVVQDIILKNGVLNVVIVGQLVVKIVELVGFIVLVIIKILIGEVINVDESELFVYEKLFLMLVMYCVKDFEDVVVKVEKLVVMGGIGYIFCLYIDQDNQLVCVVYFG